MIKLQSQSRVLELLIDGSIGQGHETNQTSFGLGTARTLHELWDVLGVNINEKRISERARWGGLKECAFVQTI